MLHLLADSLKRSPSLATHGLGVNTATVELTNNSTSLKILKDGGAQVKRSFGQALRGLRQKAGVSQRRLAQRIGVDFSYISKIENEKLPPPAADTVVMICQALNEPPEELLALTGKIPSQVEKAVATSLSAQEFLREVQAMKLSDTEWKAIRTALSQLRKANE